MLWTPIAVLAATIAGEPDRSVWTPSLPVASSEPSRLAPRNAEPEILYINFDGAVLQSGCGNDAHYDCSTLAHLFDGYVGPFNGNLNQRMAILQATRDLVADFGIRVVVDRPPDDVDYTMVIYGELGSQSFAGIAPYIDCEDLRSADASFSDAFDGSNTGSTIILQEAAHTWGLEHVDSEFDILNPFKAGGIHQVFQDECFPIVANTNLEPTPGSCNQIHQLFCDPGFQNSFREMKHLFGDHIPDVEAPQVEITYPNDGDVFVFPADFALEGEIRDNLDPQFYTIEVFRDGQPAFDTTHIALDLALTDAPPGEYNLRIRVTDEGGNAGEAEVSFTILPQGSELPDQDGDPPEVNEGEGCRVAPPTGASLFVLPLLLLLARRRKV